MCKWCFAFAGFCPVGIARTRHSLCLFILYTLACVLSLCSFQFYFRTPLSPSTSFLHCLLPWILWGFIMYLQGPPVVEQQLAQVRDGPGDPGCAEMPAQITRACQDAFVVEQ